jgi:hypothetical protein
MFIRESIHSEIKKGLLKKEFCETHLLEIREYHLRLEKYKSETVKKIDDIFKELIRTLKNRKNELISEVLEKFNEERDKIAADEAYWSEKQDISEKLLSIMNDRDDTKLLMNSKFILDGLRRLNEDLCFKEIRVYNDLDTTLRIDKGNISLSHEEIADYLSKYLEICDPNVLEYKS